VYRDAAHGREKLNMGALGCYTATLVVFHVRVSLSPLAAGFPFTPPLETITHEHSETKEKNKTSGYSARFCHCAAWGRAWGALTACPRRAKPQSRVKIVRQNSPCSAYLDVYPVREGVPRAHPHCAALPYKEIELGVTDWARMREISVQIRSDLWLLL